MKRVNTFEMRKNHFQNFDLRDISYGENKMTNKYLKLDVGDFVFIDAQNQITELPDEIGNLQSILLSIIRYTFEYAKFDHPDRIGVISGTSKGLSGWVNFLGGWKRRV